MHFWLLIMTGYVVQGCICIYNLLRVYISFYLCEVKSLESVWGKKHENTWRKVCELIWREQGQTLENCVKESILRVLRVEECEWRISLCAGNEVCLQLADSLV